MTGKNKSIVVYCFFGLIILFGILFFARNWMRYNKELNDFEKQKRAGTIVNLKDMNKGVYSIQLSTFDKVPNLRLGWEIKKYNIKIGDSVCKEANSKIMAFYQLKNGVFEKCCDYEIGM